jgi:hypothetical protein
MTSTSRFGAKICGLSTPETLAAAVTGGAAFVGFVFFARSPRNLEPEAAARLVAPLRQTHVRTVAVTVDPDDALVDRLMATLKPDLIQVHGKETPSRVREIAPALGRRGDQGLLRLLVRRCRPGRRLRRRGRAPDVRRQTGWTLMGKVPPCPAEPAHGSTGACWKADDFLARISWPEGWTPGTWRRRSRLPARPWWTFPLALSGVPA